MSILKSISTNSSSLIMNLVFISIKNVILTTTQNFNSQGRQIDKMTSEPYFNFFFFLKFRPMRWLDYENNLVSRLDFLRGGGEGGIWSYDAVSRMTITS